MKKQLDGLKKLREQFALGELRREMQDELDKGHEELAVTDDQGVKVKAEAIQTLALVEKREKQAELAREVKEVAKQLRDQAQDERKKASEWAVAPETPAAGQKKELKQTVASYKDIERLAQNRDILRMILTASADRGRAGKDYREVYENYRRMMRAFLFAQGLPSGEAEYVERYFKAIKPRETKADVRRTP
jgi:hypothetical protein